MSVRFQPADRRGEVVRPPPRSLARFALDLALFSAVVLGLPWLWLARLVLPAARGPAREPARAPAPPA